FFFWERNRSRLGICRANKIGNTASYCYYNCQNTLLSGTVYSVFNCICAAIGFSLARLGCPRFSYQGNASMDDYLKWKQDADCICFFTVVFPVSACTLFIRVVVRNYILHRSCSFAATAKKR